jgi:hypothetical protein
MWWHATKSFCVSRNVALTQHRVHEALTVAKALLSNNNDACPSSSRRLNAARDAVVQYQKPQPRKVQLQLTLRELSHIAELTIPGDAACTVGSVIAPLLDVAAVLESSARSYLDNIVTCVPSAKLITVNLEKHSVLRIWQYDEGADCRTHCDPGLVTALLRGSLPGLEVTFDKVVPSRLASGDYRSTKRTTSTSDGACQVDRMDDVDWTPVEALSNLSSDASPLTPQLEPVLILAGTQTEVLTSHCIRGVPHRVVCQRQHGAHRPTARAPRVNIILELRPEHAKTWYGFQPAESEKIALHEFFHSH